MAILTGNALKIIAAISMVIDHAGLMFFPNMEIFRIIGRLAFPIFAFMIAEGCRYTRNRLRYWGMLTALASLCQIVYYFFDGSAYFSVLVTFSAAILVIYALDYWKRRQGFPGAVVFLGAMAALWLANEFLTIDRYGISRSPGIGRQARVSRGLCSCSWLNPVRFLAAWADSTNTCSPETGSRRVFPVSRSAVRCSIFLP